MKKTIEGYPKYEITDGGKVFSKYVNRYISGGKNDKGYRIVILYNSSRHRHFYVHRLVACHFVPNPYGYPVVNHIDGDKTNNHRSNLEWCTDSNNKLHAYRIGLHDNRTRQGAKRKLFLADVQKVIALRKQGMSHIEIANIVGITPGYSSRIASGKYVHTKLPISS